MNTQDLNTLISPFIDLLADRIVEKLKAEEPKDKPAKSKPVKSKPAKEEQPIDIADLQSALVAMMHRCDGDSGEGGREKVKALLEKYGARKLQDVKPEDYPALLAEAKGE